MYPAQQERAFVDLAWQPKLNRSASSRGGLVWQAKTNPESGMSPTFLTLAKSLENDTQVMFGFVQTDGPAETGIRRITHFQGDHG